MRCSPQKWFAKFQNQQGIFLTIITWVAGIICGSFIAVFVGDTYYSFLEVATSHPVSFAGLALSIALPMLLLYFAVRVNIRSLLLVTVFVKVTLVTACTLGLNAIYGPASWLVRLFVQFSDILTLPIFCWLSLRGIRNPFSKVTCIAVSVWYLLICLTDYCVISPFFAGLIVK